MTRNNFTVASCVVFMLLFACSSKNSTGVITETTNGARVAGNIYANDGAPLSGTGVVLQAIASCNGCTATVKMQTISDNGRFSFDNVLPGTYMLHTAPSEALAAAATVGVADDIAEIEAPDLQVKPTVSFTGTISDISGTAPVNVAVCGTDIGTVTDAMGNYSLTRLPQAPLLFRYSRQGAVPNDRSVRVCSHGGYARLYREENYATRQFLKMAMQDTCLHNLWVPGNGM